MFSYEFMQTAFVVGLLLAVIIPLLGVVIVLRHLSMIGDSLSHVSLAGVAAGFLFGINPVAGAICASVAGALSIEVIRRQIPRYSEVAIAIVTSGGVGLAGVLSGFSKNAANFNSFLFGSIVAISDEEFVAVIALSILMVVLFFLFWREFKLMAFDEHLALLAGVPLSFLNTLLTLMTAVAVALAARAVGALIVSALMVIPVVSALLVAQSYKTTVLLSIAYSVVSMITALILAFYAGLKPGGTIVLVSIGLLVITLCTKKVLQAIRAHFVGT